MYLNTARKAKPSLIVAFAIVISGCQSNGDVRSNFFTLADTIYMGGDIITVNEMQPNVEAVAVKDGKILAVGTRMEIEKTLKGSQTRIIDLAGKTLIPGFVDAHSHFINVGFQSLSANLLPPPDGPGVNIAVLQKSLTDFMVSSSTPRDYGILIGFNYDDSQLAEKRHPTRQDLDAVSATVPILVIHQSGHLAVLNSAGLAKAGIAADTEAPSGGVIRREADGKTPNGVLEENGFYAYLPKLLPQLTTDQLLEQVEAAQKVYAANGITTAQEGRAMTSMSDSLFFAADHKKLAIDVVSYPDLVETAASLGKTGQKVMPFVEGGMPTPQVSDPSLARIQVSRNYVNHLRVGGAKLTFDGSPQGKTAWFTTPYFQPPEGQNADYVGYPAFPNPGEAQKWVDLTYKNNWQLLVHANGDAAIDELIKTVGDAQKKFGAGDRRTVLIHGQYLRADQIPQLQALGIVPSLYPMHTFYWGDWHRQSVAGPERAEFISPTGAVLKTGMRFTIHSDAPVTFPNSMRVLDSAVNRTTRTGYVLGPDQRISPEVALKAMTLWPAWQHFEEASKGSIEAGKLADLVILSANPMKVAPETIKDIQIVETIKEGKTIYTAKPPKTTD